VKAEGKGLRITWNDDGHQSIYEWDWLHLHSYNPRLERYLPSQADFTLWGAEIRDKPPTVPYDAIMNPDDSGVGEWTAKIREYGFSYVSDCPVTPEATQALIERIAFIRPTHYGGFWDFTADLTHKDTAYTTLSLGAHTDTTYFSEPCGLQMFHLLSHTEGSGGESLLVDGFAAAKILRQESPEAYKILSHKGIPSHASGNEGISIQPYAPFPLFNHHPVNGDLVQIRWNNDDRATMDRWDSSEDLEGWYDAAGKWAEILRRKDVEFWELLKPGRPVIFDNWRVLHGRAAFNGKRRLCGGYVARDDYTSRQLMTSWSREDVMKSL
jgi:trimethyllysine dioxygenase